MDGVAVQTRTELSNARRGLDVQTVRRFEAVPLVWEDHVTRRKSHEENAQHIAILVCNEGRVLVTVRTFVILVLRRKGPLALIFLVRPQHKRPRLLRWVHPIRDDQQPGVEKVVFRDRARPLLAELVEGLEVLGLRGIPGVRNLE